MKILTPVLASLAAATLSLSAQTEGGSTTTTTTVTTPSPTVATPSATVSTPAATVTAPSATVTTPSASVVTPSPAPAASATVESGSAAVTTPSATATAPSAVVTPTPGITAPATPTATTPPAGHPIAGYIAQEDQWIEGPPALPGAQMMVLHGDINKPGPYTIRLRLPAGYKVPLHWNDNEVNMTVISGTLHIGIAPNFDTTNSKEIGPLSFATLPPRMKHTEWVDSDTIVQVHGLGPWIMHLVYPSATVRAGP